MNFKENSQKDYSEKGFKLEHDVVILEPTDQTINNSDNSTKAPNGGKCPHCKDGYLYWLREDEYKAQYYQCGKCNSVVKV